MSNKYGVHNHKSLYDAWWVYHAFHSCCIVAYSTFLRLNKPKQHGVTLGATVHEWIFCDCFGQENISYSRICISLYHIVLINIFVKTIYLWILFDFGLSCVCTVVIPIKLDSSWILRKWCAIAKLYFPLKEKWSHIKGTLIFSVLFILLLTNCASNFQESTVNLKEYFVKLYRSLNCS